MMNKLSLVWHKIATKALWDKACADACAAGRTEVPAALQAQRDVEKKKQKGKSLA